MAAAPLAPRRAEDLDHLIAGLQARHPRSVGRAISRVEDGGALQRELIRRV